MVTSPDTSYHAMAMIVLYFIKEKRTFNRSAATAMLLLNVIHTCVSVRLHMNSVYEWKGLAAANL